MGQKHILVITIYPKAGSGYATLIDPILDALQGEKYDVKMLALDNRGEEHHHAWGVIPTVDYTEVQISVHNLKSMWGIDLVVVALDMPLQEMMINSQMFGDIPVIVITPMENGPMLKSVAASLSLASKVFFISEFAVREAALAGLKADHLPVEIDTEFWQPAVPAVRDAIRKNLGFDEDTKIILTVAENQERKNLAAAFEAVSIFKKKYSGIKFKYVLVSTEYHPTKHNMGNRLTELAQDMGIADEFVMYEKGFPNSQLLILYQMADVFLLSSKAEGLGLPVLEAMACELPVVANQTGALTELLSPNHDGYLVPPAYTMTDVWMNSRRDFMDTQEAAEKLVNAISGKSRRPNSRALVQDRQGRAVEVMLKAVEELCKA